MPTPNDATSFHLPLSGQTALVTGANSGIGLAVAEAMGQAGANVVVNYVTGPDAAAAVVAGIRARGGQAVAVQGDVSREDDVEAMFHAAVQTFGTVDVLVNNAGLQRNSPIAGMSLADWSLVIAVNLTGQFLCARAAVREFRRRGVRPGVSAALGKIICMSSVHQVIPWAHHANYAASKGGVAMLMKTLAQELAPEHIRVNAIAPGAIRTPINRAAWDTQAASERLLKLIPYGRIGEPVDIGKAAVWLASDASDYVTGTTLFIDGGMALYPEFADNG